MIITVNDRNGNPRPYEIHAAKAICTYAAWELGIIGRDEIPPFPCEECDHCMEKAKSNIDWLATGF